VKGQARERNRQQRRHPDAEPQEQSRPEDEALARGTDADVSTALAAVDERVDLLRQLGCAERLL
jgi:hypothetical protein